VLDRIPKWVLDWVLAGLVGAASIGNAVQHSPRLVTVPLALAATIALLYRRRAPRDVLVLEVALASAAGVAGDDWLIPAVLVALGTYAANVDRGRSFRALLWSAAIVALPIAVHRGVHSFTLVPQLALFLVAWLWGENSRSRELEREERLRSAAAEERARIARELHDVVTHNVSVMVVQAAAGNDVFDERPDRAREALRAVEQTGRQALAELRRLLDVEADGGGTLPQPGLARVGELVEPVRAAGIWVDLAVEGEPKPLPEAVDLSAYRIVQEALTNTLKHARASHVSVRVRYERDSVEVRVADDGVGAPVVRGEGRGLVGMRERVALFGGELKAGTQPEGGFAVEARMPVAAT
jgi:signal transduction histidine kinase